MTSSTSDLFAQFNQQRKTSYSSSSYKRSGSSDEGKKASAFLNESSTEFAALMDNMESMRAKLIGVYCPSAKILEYEIEAEKGVVTLDISFAPDDVFNLFGREFVELLIKKGKLDFYFPFSNVPADEPGRMVLRCKSCAKVVPEFDIMNASIPVVIIPTAYKPFKGLSDPKPGVSLRVTTFILSK